MKAAQTVCSSKSVGRIKLARTYGQACLSEKSLCQFAQRTRKADSGSANSSPLSFPFAKSCSSRSGINARHALSLCRCPTVDASIQIQGDVSTSSLEHQKETDPLHRSRVRRLSRSRVLQAFERNSKQLIRQFCEPFSEPKSYGDLLGQRQ